MEPHRIPSTPQYKSANPVQNDDESEDGTTAAEEPQQPVQSAPPSTDKDKKAENGTARVVAFDEVAADGHEPQPQPDDDPNDMPISRWAFKGYRSRVFLSFALLIQASLVVIFGRFCS